MQRIGSGDFADLLVEAYRSGKAMPLPPSEMRPTTRQDALRVQDEVAKRLGEKVGGWKIGATSKAVQKKQGLDGPIPGRIFSSGIHFSPARIPASRCPSATLECEIAFRISKNLPRRDRPFTPAEIDPHAVCHFAVEVTASRFANFDSLHPPSPYDLIADNGGGAAFVFGKPISNWKSINLRELSVELSIADRPPPENFTGEYRRDPGEVMAETIAHAHARGFDVHEGDFISTGSIVVPPSIYPGESAVAKFGTLDTILLTLDKNE